MGVAWAAANGRTDLDDCWRNAEEIMTQPSGKLVRVLGFWAIVAYGVGDILGAGPK